MGNVTIRKAERQDVPMLLEFIRGIARYEKMENEVVATPEVLEREMFDEHRAEAVLSLLLHLVKIAREHHCGRMEWTCLNWNKPSIDFYLSLGAVPMKDWTVYRLDSTALERLSK